MNRTRTRTRTGAAALVLSVLLCGAAHASDALPAADRYALVIGNNTPGPGQEALRYAEDDAHAVATLLTELGAYPAAHTTVLESPSRDEAVAALDAVSAQVKARAEAGAHTVFTFYYSGHARSDGLDFGADPLSLDELRAKLVAVPSTVTVVVLDACRSGAFSRIKGAEPVEDFSVSSVARLNARGMVVMASSSAGELSQESEALGGSFFTHHLLVALRGAADVNADGRVGLSEAYNYAYNQTLLSTARTAVGRQHVTFESQLGGQGDLPLTAPSMLPTHLVLGADLRGDLVISSLRSDHPVVIAEINKVAGANIRLSVAPGLYEGLLERDDKFYRCPLEVPPGAAVTLRADACTEDTRLAAAAKGVQVETELYDWSEGWIIELSLGGGGDRSTDYTRRLNSFGYQEQLFEDGAGVRAQAKVGKLITPNLAVLVGTQHLGYERYVLNQFDSADDRDFEFSAMGIPVVVRGQLPLWDNVLVPYVQAGGGLAFAQEQLQGSDSEIETGYLLTAGAGLQLNPWRHVGFLLEYGASYAPILTNLIGDTHDHGGQSLLVGLRGAL